ncbi:MAG: type II toxin-antitoxin system RelE/ParE family toxin [Deltaproteobacteria bacterium]
MAALIWNEEALADLEGIYDFIARDSPLYAQFQVEKIFKSAERLTIFPASGRSIPEFPSLPHREIIVDSYRVIYRYLSTRDEIKIVTVVHGRRLMKEDSLI